MRILLLLTLAATLGAQRQALEPPTFRSQTDLAMVSFNVVDHHRYVTGLRRDDFRILVDGQVTEPSLFEGGGSAPPKIPTIVSLLFDCSLSMYEESLINPDVIKRGLLDELENVAISIYGFSEETVRLLKPSRNTEEMRKALSGLASIPSTHTGLNNALLQVIADPANAEPNARRMIVIFSDGFAGTDYRRVIDFANRAGVQLYPVRIQADPAKPREWFEPTSARSRPSRADVRPARARPTPESEAQSYLRLGPATNGESFSTYSTGGEFLPRILKGLVERQRAQYTAGVYIPAGPSHRVRVALKPGVKGEVRGGERVIGR
jgi:VWFA-related protein